MRDGNVRVGVEKVVAVGVGVRVGVEDGVGIEGRRRGEA